MAKWTTSGVVIVLLTGCVPAWAQPNVMTLEEGSRCTPFYENFDGGLGQGWRVTHGQPIVTNGRLGAAVAPLSIETGDASLRDCTVDLDYWLANGFVAFRSQVMVVFNNTLRYVLDCCWSKWEQLNGNDWQEVAKGEGGDVNGHLQIRVHGNTHTVFINNQKRLEITPYGPPAMGPLGIVLNSDNRDAFIDNFQITSTPQDARQP